MESSTRHEGDVVEYAPWHVMNGDAAPAERVANATRVAALRERGHDVAESAFVARGAVVDARRFALGECSYLAAHMHVRGEVEIGADCSLNVGTEARGLVRIGDGVRIGARSAILGFDSRGTRPTCSAPRAPGAPRRRRRAATVPDMTSAPELVAIVPAGGAGTRLWPLSRRSRPKFLLDLLGTGRTLLQDTADRLAPLTGPDGLLVVTGTAHAAAVADQLPQLAGDGAANLLTEPSPRDSMAAIGLAAAVVEHRHGPTVVGSFAADHVVPEPGGFHDAVRTAVEAARAGYVTTIGIAATGPSTAFGYVRRGAPLEGVPGAYAVASFVEKPDEDTARGYLATGEYSWNAGMFVVRTDVLLGHLARHQPTLEAGLREIAAAWDTPAREEVLARVWPGLTKIAIDHAIAEPVAAEGGVAVVPGAFSWDDVGDWDALGGLLPADEAGAHTLAAATSAGDNGAARPTTAGPLLAIDSPDAVIASDGGAVAVLGLPGVVVVRTGDAVLVVHRDHAQRVKAVVDALAAGGRPDLL
ncbi:sugar phosphate nucleotidyltransferase [Miniimonas sp. S16]|uniref:mannose-1-phosphate guanylyltransferase n=1 Tax=Miniimonas sp. S16 TaxID=2171623 RepID=UPI00351A63AB